MNKNLANVARKRKRKIIKSRSIDMNNHCKRLCDSIDFMIDDDSTN